MKTLYTNGYTIFGESISLIVENDKIIESVKDGQVQGEYDTAIDLYGNVVIPGMFDMMGVYDFFNRRIDAKIELEGKSYLKGGITTLIEYPLYNTETLNYFDIMYDKIKVRNEKSLVNFSIGNYYDNLCKSAHNIYSLLKVVKLPELVSEDKTTIHDYLLKLEEIFADEKLVVISMDDKNVNSFFKYYKNKKQKILFINISSRRKFDRIQAFKNNGFDFYTLLYIDSIFIANDMVENKAFQRKYSLFTDFSTKEDCKYFIQMIKADKVDLIIPNHVPSSMYEKVEQGKKGNPNAETFLMLLIDLCRTFRVTLQSLNKVLFENPRKIFGLENCFSLDTGCNASFSVVDVNNFWFVKNADIISQAKWTPFENKQLWGKVLMTIVNGTLAYHVENGEDVFEIDNLVCKLLKNNEELFEVESSQEERQPNKTKSFELSDNE